MTKMTAAPVTGAQVQAIADTAAQLAAKNKPIAAPAKADAKTSDTKPADPKAAAAKAPDPKPRGTPDKKTADAKPATRRRPQQAATTTAAATPPAADAATPGVQVTDSHLTKNGAILSFKGAGTRGSAVYHSRPHRLDRAAERAQFRRRGAESRAGRFRGRA